MKACARAGLIAMLLLGPSPAAAQDDSFASRTVRVTAPQLFDLADQLLLRGERQKAAAILSALAQDPDLSVRNEARFRRANILAANGSRKSAALLLRQILDDDPDALAARVQLARLLDQLGEKDAAWRELRAIRAGKLSPAVARLIDRYSEALRAQRPFGASIELALTPDSNINRSTRSDTLGTVIGDFEIDQRSKAKSGIGLAVQPSVYRRIPIMVDGSTFLLRANGLANLYKSKALNNMAVDVAAGPEFQLGPNRINLEVGTTQRWFGRKPFQRSARIAGSWTRPLGNRGQIGLGASAALVDDEVNDLQDGEIYSGQVSVEGALSRTMGLALSVGIDRHKLNDPGYSTVGWRAGVAGWRDIRRLTVTAAAELVLVEADARLLLFPHKRSDRTTRLSVGATFRHIQLHGFAPVVRASLERSRSTIEFYEYGRTRMEFGAVRAF